MMRWVSIYGAGLQAKAAAEAERVKARNLVEAYRRKYENAWRFGCSQEIGPFPLMKSICPAIKITEESRGSPVRP